MNPVIKQNAARGPVDCAGSTSVFRCCQKVGLDGFSIASSASCPSLLWGSEWAVWDPPSTVVMADIESKTASSGGTMEWWMS